jgi:hypothetical protein
VGLVEYILISSIVVIFVFRFIYVWNKERSINDNYELERLWVLVWFGSLVSVIFCRYFNFFFMETLCLVIMFIVSFFILFILDGGKISNIAFLLVSLIFIKPTYHNILDVPNYIQSDFSYNEGYGYVADVRTTRGGTTEFLMVNGKKHNLNYYGSSITKKDNGKTFKVKYLPHSIRTFSVEVIKYRK